VFVFIVAIFFIATAILFYRIDIKWLSYVMIAVVVLIAINFFTKKFIIDMDRQTITGKHTVFSPAKTYHLKDFTNFEVLATKYMGFITTNVLLSIHFHADGKDKKLVLGQAVSHKGIQKMINETEDIMNSNHLNDERSRSV
jgi:energy-coupling factor transporter transmembrane protein EcfT